MDDFVANPWSGPIVAVALWFAALGLWLRLRRRLLRLCAGCLGLFAVALGVGTTAERLQRDHFLADFPAPGRLIDVGGFRLHLLCQGPQTAGVTIVWIAGGYGQGLWLNHLHKAVLDHARSCLFDPAGTGWSDSGPFPRTIDRQVEELHRTLAGAGENGPFLLVGHSLGGMLAANYAGRHPEEVAGLVALDGITTIDSSLRREFPCPQMVLAGRVLAWLNRFGLMTIWPSLNPYAGADAATQYAPLAAVWPQIAPQETRVGAVLGEASAVGQSCMGAGDLVRTDPVDRAAARAGR
jgi:pimeloyl-ACP methyl ester carboxylesterase